MKWRKECNDGESREFVIREAEKRRKIGVSEEDAKNKEEKGAKKREVGCTHSKEEERKQEEVERGNQRRQSLSVDRKQKQTRASD